MKIVSMIPNILMISILSTLAGCARQSKPATPSSAPRTPTPAPATPTPPPATSTSIPPSPTPLPPAFIKGVDASYLQQIEDAGGIYSDKGIPTDALQIYKNHGINFIRLRVWHTPLIGYNNLDHTLKMAKRVKALNMSLLIDLHYSDTWADPAKQTKPAAWDSLPFDQLVKAVHDYTRDVVTALKKQGTLPEMIQLGNEITPGMLWDNGRVGGDYDKNWPQLAALLKAGASGVQDSLSGAEKVQILLHVDAGGNNAICRGFFDHILEQDIPFDLIGLSYYPWWHGSLADLENNVKDLAERYQRPVLIVETAYPWTLENNDDMGNLVGPQSQLLPDFPPTVEGQLSFLLKEKEILKSIPSGRGLGMFYWGADDITSPRFGSVFENAATFDFKGQALDSLNAFLTP